MIAGFESRKTVPAELHGGGRFVLARKDFVPAYVKAFAEGILQQRARQAVESLRSCRVCPRDCEIDRLQNQVGVCRIGRRARVASAFPHFGEEDCLRGWRGSGTIFFSGCNLRCVFCQNHDISQHGSPREIKRPGSEASVTRLVSRGEGTEVTAAALARTMLDLQAAGCHNINLVTPEHVVPQILEALPAAIEGGLRLPLVYNTSAYDSLESLRLLDGVVDIYMPDFKLWHAEACAKYLVARDYAEAARAAIAAMHAQVGELKVDEDGLALRGVLVRHLVMPGLLEDTREILRWLASLARDTYVNVMDQYRPAYKVKTESRFGQINRRVQDHQFEQALECARAVGLWRLDPR